VTSKRRSVAFWIYVGSVGFHVVLGAVTLTLPRPKTNEIVAIQLAEAKKKAQPPKPAPPPPPPPPPQEKPKPKPAQQTHQEQAKVAPQTKTEALPPVPVGADGFADLGIALGNSDGPGIPIPTGPAAGGAADTAAGSAAKTKPVATHKVEQLAVAQGAEVCNEPVVRPKRQGFAVPKYTMEARQAEIEGVVRVEVTVDETGHVIRARVLSGLGYGLDESAVQAAKQMTFTPATQCGKPVVGTAVVPFNFQLT
jgi:protein TonB